MHVRFAEFLLGILLARAVGLGLRLRRPALAGSLSITGLALLVAALTWLNLRQRRAAVAPVAALVARWVLLGEWSFALHLVHKPLFLLTQSWGWRGNSAERAPRTVRLRPAPVPSAATTVDGVAAVQARMPAPGHEISGLVALRR